jgi:putative NADH-flavin reductase
MKQQDQRLLIFGATGRTGRLAVDYALEKGIAVVALARHPEKLAPRPHLTLLSGTPEKLDDVRRAITGCTSVLSFLNNARASDSPWSKPLSPPRLMSTSITHAVAAMNENAIRRIVVLSAAGVGDSAGSVPWLWRAVVRHSYLKVAYDDHEAQEAVLRSSGLDWTAVRAAGLLGNKLQRTRISYDNQPKPRLFISRKQTATFMVDCLLHPEFFAKAPVASAE